MGWVLTNVLTKELLPPSSATAHSSRALPILDAITKTDDPEIADLVFLTQHWFYWIENCTWRVVVVVVVGRMACHGHPKEACHA